MPIFRRMVVVEEDNKRERLVLLARLPVLVGALALLFLLQQTVPLLALIGIVLLGCTAAIGCPRLKRRLAERRELVAWVEKNTFPDQTISEWLADATRTLSLQEATSEWLYWEGTSPGSRRSA